MLKVLAQEARWLRQLPLTAATGAVTAGARLRVEVTDRLRFSCVQPSSPSTPGEHAHSEQKQCQRRAFGDRCRPRCNPHDRDLLDRAVVRPEALQCEALDPVPAELEQ